MLNFDRIADKFDKDQQPANNSEIQTQVQVVKKNNKSSLYVLLLGFAVVIVGGLSTIFGRR